MAAIKPVYRICLNPRSAIQDSIMSFLSPRAIKPLLMAATIADPVSGAIPCDNCGDKAPARARGSQIRLACSKSEDKLDWPSIRDQLAAFVCAHAPNATANDAIKSMCFIYPCP